MISFSSQRLQIALDNGINIVVKGCVTAHGVNLQIPRPLVVVLLTTTFACCLSTSGCRSLDQDAFFSLSNRFVERYIQHTWYIFAADDRRSHIYRVADSGRRHYLGSTDGYGDKVALALDGESIVHRHKRRRAQLFGPGSRLLAGGIYVCGPEGPRRRFVLNRALKQGFVRDYNVPDHVVCIPYNEAIDPDAIWVAAYPDGKIVPLTLLDPPPFHVASYSMD